MYEAGSARLRRASQTSNAEGVGRQGIPLTVLRAIDIVKRGTVDNGRRRPFRHDPAHGLRVGDVKCRARMGDHLRIGKRIDNGCAEPTGRTQNENTARHGVLYWPVTATRKLSIVPFP